MPVRTIAMGMLWPKLRALLITFGLLVQLVGALPSRGFGEDAMQRPEGQRAVAWLQRGLGLFGVTVAAPALTADLITGSARVAAVRNEALRPFEPWFRLTQTHQQWSLFTNPRRECFRLHVDARRDARKGRPAEKWRRLYRAGGEDTAGLSAVLRYRRLRGSYNPHAIRGPRVAYDGFATWVARRILSEHREYHAVRVRMERLAIGAPGTKPQRLGFEHVITRKRSELP